ncbi:DNA polymerase IV [soil metagenome]
MSREIIHVDMDAFFASVEELDDPSLRGKPVLVGGKSMRSVVAAASYAARKFGCHSAMPMAEALRRCPQAVVVVPHRERYEEVSHAIFEVFRRYTPLVEGLSVDEAFLDVTASRSLFGDGATIARRIKDDIQREIQLTASAGVAPCKFVAKVASDLRKPDGLVVVREEEVMSLLAPLPIERMWGVGPKTSPKLRALGYATLGDLASAKLFDLERVLGSWGLHVRALARGEDPRTVDPNIGAKSIGAEETYERDLTTRDVIERCLLDHSNRIAQRLVVEGVSASIVTVKLKYTDFSVRSRQLKLPLPVADTLSIHRAAVSMLDRFERRDPVRLTGVSVSGLCDGPPPELLFDEGDRQKQHTLEQVSAKVAAKFEGALLTRATLLEKGESRTGNAGTTRGIKRPAKPQR